MAVRFAARTIQRAVAARVAQTKALARSRAEAVSGLDGDNALEEALLEALEIMESMIGNAGQATVYERYIVPAFIEAFQVSKVTEGWEEVDIGEYMAFVGIIVDEGNQFMVDAYEEAAIDISG